MDLWNYVKQTLVRTQFITWPPSIPTLTRSHEAGPGPGWGTWGTQGADFKETLLDAIPALAQSWEWGPPRTLCPSLLLASPWSWPCSCGLTPFWCRARAYASISPSSHTSSQPSTQETLSNDEAATGQGLWPHHLLPAMKGFLPFDWMTQFQNITPRGHLSRSIPSTSLVHLPSPRRQSLWQRCGYRQFIWKVTQESRNKGIWREEQEMQDIFELVSLWATRV